MGKAAYGRELKASPEKRKVGQNHFMCEGAMKILEMANRLRWIGTPEEGESRSRAKVTGGGLNSLAVRIVVRQIVRVAGAYYKLPL